MFSCRIGIDRYFIFFTYIIFHLHTKASQHVVRNNCITLHKQIAQVCGNRENIWIRLVRRNAQIRGIGNIIKMPGLFSEIVYRDLKPSTLIQILLKQNLKHTDLLQFRVKILIYVSPPGKFTR